MTKKIKTETHSAHITAADGNIFMDLGFPPKYAKILKEKSERRISEKPMLGNSHTSGYQTNKR